MPPLDSITLKHTFVNDMLTEGWRSYARFYMDTAREQKDYALISDQVYDATTFTQMLTRVTHMSQTFYISPTMHALVTAAAEAMPEDEPIREHDFPAQQGWLYIPGGITVVDHTGSPNAISVVLWDCHGGSVYVHHIADKRHPVYAYENEHFDQMPRLSALGHTKAGFDLPLPQTLITGRIIPPEQSSQIRVWFDEQPNGDPALLRTSNLHFYFPEGWSPAEMVAHRAPDPLARWLVACLRIMQQPLASVSETGLPTNLRKQMARAKVRLKNTHVSVIEFRKRESDFADGSERQYSHRFFRRGHWRRQPFKNEQGEWDRRLTWIHPTIVGDPSLPFLMRDHVNALVR